LEQLYDEGARVTLGGVGDTVREPLVVLDESLRVLAANPAFHAAFGTSEPDIIGVPIFDLAGGQWNSPALRDLLHDVLAERSAFDDFEIAYTGSHGSKRRLLLNAREIVESASRRRTILLAIDDITRRTEIEQALAERTRELERSNRELEQFAAVASHDLQEPLRKIRTYGGLLKQRYGAVLEGDAAVYIDRMDQAASRMQSLIGDVLLLSRLTGRERKSVPVSLGRVVHEVLGDLETALRDAGARTNVGDLPVVMGDPVMMRQLFQNILSNSLKFRNPEAPVEINVTALPPCQSGKEVAKHTIAITDNGIGFDQRHAELIFEPFKRLHGRDERSGSGIGLAICRSIVDRHGGEITARSAAGQGTTVTVTLPAAEPAVASPGSNGAVS
jgi:PAS domain S-box-containing protein